MKRLYALLVVATLSLGIVGCGKDTAKDQAVEATIFEEAEVVEAETEEPAAEDVASTFSNGATGGEGALAEGSEGASEESAVEGASGEQENADGDAASLEGSEGAEGAENTENADNASEAQSQEGPRPLTAEEASQQASEVASIVQVISDADKKVTKKDYGRILFVGDSRTVDMFSAEAEEIRGDVHNNIPVYCRNGCKYQYMVDAVNEYGLDNFDTLVSWMGCNDFGVFDPYGPYYDSLLAAGKNVVVCTVGPTKDECLIIDVDYLYYPNKNQINYNKQLVNWANSKGVQIIDLYSYISNSSTVTINPEDGIHYLPQPTTELWNVILGSLK